MIRRLTSLAACLMVGLGAGVLSWGIATAATGESLRISGSLTSIAATASEVIGYGAGLFAAGVAALALRCAESE